MKVIALFAAILAVALAAPQGSEKDAQIVRYDSNNIGVDGYDLNVETSNGILLQEQGSLKNVGGEEPAIVVQGQFQYKSPEGTVYNVVYTADEEGFKPSGSHLP